VDALEPSSTRQLTSAPDTEGLQTFDDEYVIPTAPATDLLTVVAARMLCKVGRVAALSGSVVTAGGNYATRPTC
jgi:hypothetical protein